MKTLCDRRVFPGVAVALEQDGWPAARPLAGSAAVRQCAALPRRDVGPVDARLQVEARAEAGGEPVERRLVGPVLDHDPFCGVVPVAVRLDPAAAAPAQVLLAGSQRLRELVPIHAAGSKDDQHFRESYLPLPGHQPGRSRPASASSTRRICSRTRSTGRLPSILMTWPRRP